MIGKRALGASQPRGAGHLARLQRQRQNDQAQGPWLAVVVALLAAAVYLVSIIVDAQALRLVSGIQSSNIIFALAGAMPGLLRLGNG